MASRPSDFRSNQVDAYCVALLCRVVATDPSLSPPPPPEQGPSTPKPPSTPRSLLSQILVVVAGWDEVEVLEAAVTIDDARLSRLLKVGRMEEARLRPARPPPSSLLDEKAEFEETEDVGLWFLPRWSGAVTAPSATTPPAAGGGCALAGRLSACRCSWWCTSEAYMPLSSRSCECVPCSIDSPLSSTWITCALMTVERR
mmetsp:Transcript_15654/g.33958  ORF Transcript_15654/g.33958 Transcript_15654/m.33958 type:complete len:200 (-) Transcript_15654:119-718(-)